MISPIYHLSRFLGKIIDPISAPVGQNRNLESRKLSRRRTKKVTPAAVASTKRSVLNGAHVVAELNQPCKAAVLVWLIALAHLGGLILLYKPISGLIDNAPLIDQDWGLHFHHLRSLASFWRQDGMSWGYNPYFMAGYPSNTIQDLSIKFFEWVAIGLSAIALSPVQWFKITAFLATASIPWLMYFSARNFFATDANRYRLAAFAALLGTAYWWNSLPREMFFYGMIGFPVASYLSVLGVSLFYRVAILPPQFGAVFFGWLLFAVAILPLHVQSILTFAPPMLVLLVMRPRSLTRRVVAWTAAAVGLAVVINLVWLIPAIAHRGDDASTAIVTQLPLFAGTDIFTFILDYVGPRGYWTFRPSFIEKGFRLALLILGGFGTWKLMHSEKRDLGLMLAAGLITLFLVSYFGALVPFAKPWQPLRFKVPFDLFLAVGAAYTVNRWLIHRAAASPLVPIVLACGSLAFIINLGQTESTGRLQIRSQLIPELQEIVDWIRSATPADARVLFEESGDETGFVYDRVYLSSLIPHMTGRQLIGGPINLYNDRHHFAEFHSGKIFKQEIQTLTDNELRNYLQLYNIGAVVAFHPASIQRLQAIRGLVTLEQRIGPVQLMRVNQPLTWFVRGEGKLKAGLNRLELSELSGSEIVLKFHWVERLTAHPFTKLEPVSLANDPIPFIKLVNPPAALTLSVESSLWNFARRP